ncbi:MAG: hypothetical protein HYU52_15245 [Acidobacteria bacterium]|nr:hypothetical protein [Acidobacteriota bacterium]
MRTMRRTATAIALLAFASMAGAQTSGVVRNGPLPAPLPLFPAGNWWNIDISAAPVDPNSASFINMIGPTRGMHPDLGGDADPSPSIYGMPFVVVPGSTPMEQVTFEYADESDYQAPGRPPGYPIPVQIRTEPKWIEGGQPGGGDEGDRHLLIVDRDNRILYELYATRWTGTHWEGGSGAIFPLDSNQRRPDGWTSADAAGLAILPGLIRYDEVYGTEPIRHAFRVTVRSTNGYVYPASHRAGNTAGALPMGARLRLKSSKDISGHAEPVRRIFQAMKTYGLIVADNGSDMYVTGTYDTRWDNDLLNPAFSSIKASDFEIVQLGWKPDEAPACTRPAITSHPQPVSVRPREIATLSASASGTMPVTWQWYRGASGNVSSPITGASSSTLQITATVTTTVWARASNACGSDDTSAAQITVSPGGRKRPSRR